MPLLELTRLQILAFRRQVNALNERMPAGAKSLRMAAWAGLQDSAPRAALLSLHARVRRATASTWEHSSLVQLWGPRYSDYLVAAQDVPIFSLGRLPQDTRRHERAQTTATRLHAFLGDRRMPFGQAGKAMGVHPNSLRYAAPTGTVLLRWDGSRQPVIWTVPAPDIDPHQARLELVRRYLHIFGPATPASFAKWAGISGAEATGAFEALGNTRTPVRTPIGDAWILAEDETEFRSKSRTAAPARLLPSGDAYFLLWGADRELLLPDAKQRAELWTTRVWPGAVLVNGEIVGVWRRAECEVTINPWRHLSAAEWDALEGEAVSMPIHNGCRIEATKRAFPPSNHRYRARTSSSAASPVG